MEIKCVACSEKAASETVVLVNGICAKCGTDYSEMVAVWNIIAVKSAAAKKERNRARGRQVMPPNVCAYVGSEVEPLLRSLPRGEDR